jgi:hypothetical protein
MRGDLVATIEGKLCPLHGFGGIDTPVYIPKKVNGLIMDGKKQAISYSSSRL